MARTRSSATVTVVYSRVTVWALLPSSPATATMPPLPAIQVTWIVMGSHWAVRMMVPLWVLRKSVMLSPAWMKRGVDGLESL